jgi:hypothetical protein
VCNNFKVQPQSFSSTCSAKNPSNKNEKLFEALYPKITGPADTRHFLEAIDESLSQLIIRDEDIHFDKFINF